LSALVDKVASSSQFDFASADLPVPLRCRFSALEAAATAGGEDSAVSDDARDDAFRQAAEEHEEFPSPEHDRGIRSQSRVTSAGRHDRWRKG